MSLKTLAMWEAALAPLGWVLDPDNLRRVAEGLHIASRADAQEVADTDEASLRPLVSDVPARSAQYGTLYVVSEGLFVHPAFNLEGPGTLHPGPALGALLGPPPSRVWCLTATSGREDCYCGVFKFVREPA